MKPGCDCWKYDDKDNQWEHPIYKDGGDEFKCNEYWYYEWTHCPFCGQPAEKE